MQPNTLTGNTSLALTALPRHSNRMMYVSWFKNIKLSVISKCYNCGVVTAPLKLKYCQLSGKAVKRPGQRHGTHDMTSPRWDDVSSICSCGSQITPPIPTPWDLGDFMLTSLTAGCWWETSYRSAGLNEKEIKFRSLRDKNELK